MKNALADKPDIAPRLVGAETAPDTVQAQQTSVALTVEDTVVAEPDNLSDIDDTYIRSTQMPGIVLDTEGFVRNQRESQILVHLPNGEMGVLREMKVTRDGPRAIVIPLIENYNLHVHPAVSPTGGEVVIPGPMQNLKHYDMYKRAQKNKFTTYNAATISSCRIVDFETLINCNPALFISAEKSRYDKMKKLQKNFNKAKQSTAAVSETEGAQRKSFWSRIRGLLSSR